MSKLCIQVTITEIVIGDTSPHLVTLKLGDEELPPKVFASHEEAVLFVASKFSEAALALLAGPELEEIINDLSQAAKSHALSHRVNDGRQN